MRADDLPQSAFAAGLASLPGAGPAWLVEVLADHSPGEAWQMVLSGGLRLRRGSTAASGGCAPGTLLPPEKEEPLRCDLDLDRLWRHCQRLAIQVTWFGHASYPPPLTKDPAPPGVLFWVGDLAALERPCVAVVGTRRCTPEGARAAYQLAYDLASAGVCVVSGLAAGIDGAAHAGALAAAQESAGQFGSTVGIAASGVDVAYPPQHRSLYREVARLGAVLSETPPGRPAQAWRFPSRNRVVAGLARMLVVVESHAGGGSWHTVEAALQRGIDVGAMPGSIHNPASAGTNTLLHEGAFVVRSAQDVLDVIAMPVVPAAPVVATRPGASAVSPPTVGSAAVQDRPAPPIGKAPRSGSAPDRAGSARLGETAASDPYGILDRKVLHALGWRP
ncbi:MAG TPA: DNA-processing protein DprA, partial [Acidimicrobiales bacterium]|nr:DNA-processing protein DprA [Acidimicrobiales bacterium]